MSVAAKTLCFGILVAIAMQMVTPLTWGSTDGKEPVCPATIEDGERYNLTRVEDAITYTIWLRRDPNTKRKDIREEIHNLVNSLSLRPFWAVYRNDWKYYGQQDAEWCLYGYCPSGTPLKFLDPYKISLLQAISGEINAYAPCYYPSCLFITQIKFSDNGAMPRPADKYEITMAFSGFSSKGFENAKGDAINNADDFQHIDALIRAIPGIDFKCEEPIEQLTLQSAQAYDAGSKKWIVAEYSRNPEDYEKRYCLVSEGRAWALFRELGNSSKPIIFKIDGKLFMALTVSYYLGESGERLVLSLEGDEPLAISLDRTI